MLERSRTSTLIRWCGLALLGLACSGPIASGGSGGGAGQQASFEVWMHADAGSPFDVGGWQVTCTIATLWVGRVELTDAGTPVTAVLERSAVVDLLGGQQLLGTAAGPAASYQAVSLQLGRLHEATVALAGRAEKNGVTKTFGTSIDQRERVSGIVIEGAPASAATGRLVIEAPVERWMAGVDFEALPVKAYALDFNNYPQAHNALVHALYAPTGFSAAWQPQ